MTDTRIQLLEAASALFIEQGFAKTTMQQLADRVGISKGAVYLHFRSKNQLFIALMQHIGESILEAVRAIQERRDLDPKQRLRAQLRYQFDDVLEHQKLMEMYVKESGIALDQELVLVSQKLRLDWQETQQSFLRDAFPDHDSRYTADLTVMVNGALNEYYTFVVLEGVRIDPDRVADFILAMTEAMVERLQVEGPPPVMQADSLPDRGELEAELAAVSAERVESALAEILHHADSLEEESATEISLTITAIREVLDEDPPNRVLLQALLANLRDYKALLPQRRQLAMEFGTKLI